jgi:soluble lytic murein transglycosylase-like protein
MKRRVFLSPLLKIFKKLLTLAFSFLFINMAFASHEHRSARQQGQVQNKRAGKQVEITEELLDALILVESSNDPRAHRHSTGARGLTQITPAAWKDLVAHYPAKYAKLKYRHDIFRPDVAREAARDYLKILARYLKARDIPITLDNLLAGYNWGVRKLDKYGLQNAPRETKRYVLKIKRRLQYYL